ncbi:MAG: acyltransferase [Clostridia bacterium]|nr:acyltransferase [Clostridia bacterium]MBQ8470190.1 acyltransferase [Clostridia bacterium]MBR1704351.1 acyltransferase [Clostridia bacterium]
MAVMDRPRIFMLDFIRALAIFLVCMGHSVEQTFHFAEKDVFFVQGDYKGMVVLMLFTLARISVPFFLFLTGYFFLPRSYDTEGTLHFWKHNFGRLLLCTELWILLYNIFDYFFWHIDLTPLSLVRQMVFLENVPAMDHYWYLPMILGVYLFLPVVANGLKHIDAKLLTIPVLFILVFFTLDPSIGNTEVTILDAGYTGGVFGTYVLLGYMVHEKVFREVKGWVLGLLAVVCFLAVHVTEYFQHLLGEQNIVWYTWFTLMVTALCCFELLDRHSGEAVIPSGVHIPVNFVARYSFAMYLTHFPMTQACVRVCYWYTDSAFLTFLVATFVPFLASLLLCRLLDRIPKVGRYLLYMR